MSDLLQRVRPYLRNGKSQLIRRPTEDQKDYIQRVISYRTEVCVAWNEAGEDGAAQDVLDYLRAEHGWALATMEVAGIFFDGPHRGEQMSLDLG